MQVDWFEKSPNNLLLPKFERDVNSRANALPIESMQKNELQSNVWLRFVKLDCELAPVLAEELPHA